MIQHKMHQLLLYDSNTTCTVKTGLGMTALLCYSGMWTNAGCHDHQKQQLQVWMN